MRNCSNFFFVRPATLLSWSELFSLPSLSSGAELNSLCLAYNSSACLAGNSSACLACNSSACLAGNTSACLACNSSACLACNSSACLACSSSAYLLPVWPATPLSGLQLFCLSGLQFFCLSGLVAPLQLLCGFQAIFFSLTCLSGLGQTPTLFPIWPEQFRPAACLAVPNDLVDPSPLSRNHGPRMNWLGVPSFVRLQSGVSGCELSSLSSGAELSSLSSGAELNFFWPVLLLPVWPATLLPVWPAILLPVWPNTSACLACNSSASLLPVWPELRLSGLQLFCLSEFFCLSGLQLFCLLACNSACLPAALLPGLQFFCLSGLQLFCLSGLQRQANSACLLQLHLSGLFLHLSGLQFFPVWPAAAFCNFLLFAWLQLLVRAKRTDPSCPLSRPLSNCSGLPTQL
ncbi:unnamed protein product [Acanthosepion pharaonis]|uniref:Uncharacterized protein n=1 Tax=Acanthosepion pharaonis TaxID=158019 RepID=A0A812EJZ0_ACAPH|nr:unnamed protein product [Sepia pharaonis]